MVGVMGCVHVAWYSPLLWSVAWRAKCPMSGAMIESTIYVHIPWSFHGNAHGPSHGMPHVSYTMSRAVLWAVP